jgi:hypothetical protein
MKKNLKPRNTKWQFQCISGEEAASHPKYDPGIYNFM